MLASVVKFLDKDFSSPELPEKSSKSAYTLKQVSCR